MTDPKLSPPPELVQQWYNCATAAGPNYLQEIADRAAQWGSNQELEACLTWFQEFYKTEYWVKGDLERFRSARRPKFYSLKQQVLRLLERPKELWSETEVEAIRLLVKQIDD
jgi:hypothetical protein